MRESCKYTQFLHHIKPMEGPIDARFSFLRFHTLESTNAWALEHLGELDNLSVIRADCQTAGRGQRGNRWLSAPGENLTFSVVLRPESLPARDQMQLTALSSVALRESLLKANYPVQIKWPNDIYFRSRKLAGMLIENRLEGDRIAASVIGIGLNVNQTGFDPTIPNPTSLRLICGGPVGCDHALEGFLGSLASWLPKLGTDELWNAYTSELWGLGTRRQWSDCATGKTFFGTITGVLKDGRLRVTMDNGTERLFAFKEIGYIL